MPAMYTTIGMSGDFPLLATDNDDWALPITRALLEGHRWLVFLDDVNGGGSFGMKSTVNLGNTKINTIPRLRLQGAGRSMTVLARTAGREPLFYSPATTAWTLHFDGVHFYGGEYDTGVPICAFGAVEDSFFKFCEFSHSGIRGVGTVTGNDGLHLGIDYRGLAPGFARRVVAMGTEFGVNADAALRISGADNIVMVGSAVEHNGTTPVDSSHPGGFGGMEWSADYPHTGIILSCHFESNGRNGLRGLYLTNGVCIRLANDYHYASKIIFDGSTDCGYQNNLALYVSDFGDPFDAVASSGTFEEFSSEIL